MITDNPIFDLLAAPISPDWTIEDLAEQLLESIVAQPMVGADEFILEADAIKDRQTQRMMRPLLACLATKYASEAGTEPNLYGGHLAFTRTGPDGPVWILVDFENKPDSVRVAFRKSSSPPKAEASTGMPSNVTANSNRAAVALSTTSGT